MKKIYALFLLPGLFLASCGSGTSVSDPEDIGPQVMEILEDLDDMSKEEFKEYFMSLEDIRELGEDEDLIKDEDGRNFLTKIEKDEYTEDLERGFTRVIENGSEQGIKWSEIEFDDFSYKIETRNGIKGCDGELTFKHGGDSYQVRTTSIWDGSGYNLLSIKGPRKKR